MFMLIVNDATVKAGAFFPMTAKKVIRAQNIAIENRIPTIYLVDSAGVFLPLQEDVFPDTDDFGRVFRNNAVMSAMGIPQITAIMGMCVAGGAYLPVMCDHILMTEGSGLFLAGPALVQAAIGMKYTPEELGGAKIRAHRRIRRGHRRQPENPRSGPGQALRRQTRRVRGRDLYRVGRKSSALHHGLQSEPRAAGFPARRERLHGRTRRRVERHHPGR